MTIFWREKINEYLTKRVFTYFECPEPRFAHESITQRANDARPEFIYPFWLDMFSSTLDKGPSLGLEHVPAMNLKSFRHQIQPPFSDLHSESFDRVAYKPFGDWCGISSEGGTI